MNEMKLMDILSLVGEVHSNKWGDVMAIVEAMPDVIVVDQRWNSIYKQDNPDLYPLDLTRLDTWSTYDRTCISLLFHNTNGVLMCDALIYDGNMDGPRKSQRFTATLLMPVHFIKHIEPRLLYALRKHAEEAYEAHLRADKEEWITFFIKSKIKK